MSRLSLSPFSMASWLSENESASVLTPVALAEAPFISTSSYGLSIERSRELSAIVRGCTDAGNDRLGNRDAAGEIRLLALTPAFRCFASVKRFRSVKEKDRMDSRQGRVGMEESHPPRLSRPTRLASSQPNARNASSSQNRLCRCGHDWMQDTVSISRL